MNVSTHTMIVMLAAALAVPACSSDGNLGAAGAGGTAGSGGRAGAGGDPGAGGEAGAGGVAGGGAPGGHGGHGGAGGDAPTLRDALPSIADDAVRLANEIPSDARRDAMAGTIAFLRETCDRWTFVCLSDIADVAQIADAAGDCAYNEAADAITAPKAAMLELKKRTLEAPDPILEEALRQALGDAYENRTVSVVVSCTATFDAPFFETYTVYSADQTYTLLDVDMAARIDAAQWNLSLLDEPYTLAP